LRKIENGVLEMSFLQRWFTAGRTWKSNLDCSGNPLPIPEGWERLERKAGCPSMRTLAAPFQKKIKLIKFSNEALK